MDALIVRADDHRLTGAGPARGHRGRRRPALAGRGGGHVGHHERGHHRRPGRRGRRSPASTACGSTWTAPTAAPGCSRRACGRAVRRDRARRLVHRGPAQVAVRAVRLRRPAVPRPVAGPLGAQAGRLLPRRHPRQARGVEPDRLRLPPDPAGPRPAAVVLAVGVRRPTPTREAIEAAIELARQAAAEIAERGPAGADPRARARRRAVPPPRLGRRAVRRMGRPAAAPTRWRSSRRPPGKARPWPGSRSCTRTPRWTWSAQILDRMT